MGSGPDLEGMGLWGSGATLSPVLSGGRVRRLEWGRGLVRLEVGGDSVSTVHTYTFTRTLTRSVAACNCISPTHTIYEGPLAPHPEAAAAGEATFVDQPPFRPQPAVAEAAEQQDKNM